MSPANDRTPGPVATDTDGGRAIALRSIRPRPIGRRMIRIVRSNCFPAGWIGLPFIFLAGTRETGSPMAQRGRSSRIGYGDCSDLDVLSGAAHRIWCVKARARGRAEVLKRGDHAVGPPREPVERRAERGSPSSIKWYSVPHCCMANVGKAPVARKSARYGGLHTLRRCFNPAGSASAPVPRVVSS